MKKLTLSILLFVLTVSTFSQKQTVLNLQQSDFKRLHFGFILGIHTKDFGVKHTEVPDKNGIVWYGDVAVPSPGFTVGIISDLRLGRYFNLRFTPSLDFGDRQIVFSGFSNGVKTDEFKTTVFSSLISFPVYFKYRAKRVNNYRPYLLAGGGVMLDLSRKKDDPILLKPFDYFVAFGVGCDFYLPYFKLAPELKMCFGFSDMLEKDRPMISIEDDLKYTQAIYRMTSRLIVLTFNFE